MRPKYIPLLVVDKETTVNMGELFSPRKILQIVSNSQENGLTKASTMSKIGRYEPEVFTAAFLTTRNLRCTTLTIVVPLILANEILNILSQSCSPQFQVFPLICVKINVSISTSISTHPEEMVVCFDFFNIHSLIPKRDFILFIIVYRCHFTHEPKKQWNGVFREMSA